MLAIGFVNPWLLPGLAIAAAPLIIHLLSRRRFRRVPWGAIRFLLEAEKKNRRRTRFEQWLLVALRTLALLLLGMLLARPFVQPGDLAALLGGEGTRLRILVLDDSGSSSALYERRPGFAQLTDAAARLVLWLQRVSPGDRVSIFLASRPESPLRTAAALTDAVAIAEELRRLEAQHVRATPRKVLAKVRDALRESRAAAVLYLFSDFQRSDWLPTEDGPEFAPLLELAADAPRTVLVALPAAPRPNTALLALAPERPQAIAGIPALLHVDVANLTRAVRSDLQLLVSVDGAALPPIAVDPLAPGEQRRVVVEATPAEPGGRTLSVSLTPGDAFGLDDVRRVVVPVRDALSVLLVNGQPAADPQQDEVFLLRSALAPPGPFASGVRVESVDMDALESAALDAYDVVLLCNIPAPSQAVAVAVQRFAQRGGGLGVFLGAQSAGDAESLNRILYADGAGVLPVPLADDRFARSDAASVGLLRAAAHPLTGMLGETRNPDVRFRGYARLVAPPEAGPAQILARFGDAENSPAIVERPCGNGRVVLFAFPSDLEWNNWAQSPDGAYVVTMLELVQYLARRVPDPPAFVAGEPVRVTVSAAEHEPSALLRSTRPDEPPVLLKPRVSSVALGDDVVLTGDPLRQVGIYQAELSRLGGTAESRPLAVNLDPRESDLSTCGDGELAAALESIPHVRMNADANFLASGDEARRELWRPLLWILLAVLLLEQTLAWWFGTPRAVGASAAARRSVLGRMVSWGGLRRREVHARG